MRSRRDGLVVVVLATVSLTLMLLAAQVLLSPWPDAVFNLDFTAYWSGSSLVRQNAGPALFDMSVQEAFQRELRRGTAVTDPFRLASGHYPFLSPPPLALAFLPLTFVPLSWAYVLWSVVSLSAFLLALAQPLRGRSLGWAPLLLILAYPSVTATLIEGQVNGVLLLALSAALMQLSRGRTFTGGALVGLLWLKPQSAVLFAFVFLFKRRWRELAGMVVVGLAVGAVSLLMVGIEGMRLYIQELYRVGAFYPPADSLISPEKMANWRSLLMNMFPGIAATSGSILVVVLGAATALGTLLAFNGRWDASSPRFGYQMLAVTLAATIASPHSHFHSTVLLLAPLAMTFAKPMKAVPFARVWRPMLLAGYTLGWLAFANRGSSWLLVPYFLAAMGLVTYQIRCYWSRHEQPQIAD